MLAFLARSNDWDLLYNLMAMYSESIVYGGSSRFQAPNPPYILENLPVRMEMSVHQNSRSVFQSNQMKVLISLLPKNFLYALGASSISIPSESAAKVAITYPASHV